MKITYLYQYFGTTNGGWSTRVYEYTRRWVAAGHKVTIITAPYYKSDLSVNKLITRINIDGIDCIVLNFPDNNNQSFFRRFFNAVCFSFFSIYFTLSIKSDICIASSGPVSTMLPALNVKWFKRIPLVMEVRDLWVPGAIEIGKLNNWLLKLLAVSFEKFCYCQADLIVPCSTGMDDEIKKSCRKAKTSVIPNASDNILFEIPATLPKMYPESLDGKRIFLYTGSLDKPDDCSQFINAIKFIHPEEPIAFVIIGEGEEKAVLQQELANLSNRNTFFLDLMPKTEIVKWYSIARGSFLTFKDDNVHHTNSPNKLFDSLAAGVPVIQTTRGWIKNLVEKEKCGINVNPASPQEFAQAIRTLAYNDDIFELCSTNAKRLAQNVFDRDFLSEKYLSAILKLRNAK